MPLILKKPRPAPKKKIRQVSVMVLPDGRMDRKNAAKYLGVKPKTMAMWATQGKGPRFRKVGGKAFYFKGDLDAYIENGD